MLCPSDLSVLRFAPLYQERVWGGRQMETLYGRRLPKEGAPYGESWEICDRPEAQSIVTEGVLAGWTLHDLWNRARNEIFGMEYADHPSARFPLLIKILDAAEDLSMQVHPDDRTAPLVKGEAKSEAWYVAHARPGARLYAGLKAGTTREAFLKSMEEGTVADYSQPLVVREGDCLAVAGGTLHAIGGGLVIFEVQQNSDTTYRVFDWNRVGLDGKPRALHQEEAMQVLDFTSPPPALQRAQGQRLLDWPYFKLDRWTLSKFEGRSVPHTGRFVIGAVIEGELSWRDGAVTRPGDFFLVPACVAEKRRFFKCLTTGASVLWTSL